MTQTAIGTYFENDVMNIEMTYDRIGTEWTFALDGTELFSGDAVAGLPTLRFSNSNNCGMFVDNIQIVGVPEPSAAIVMLPILGSLIFRRRRDL